MSEVELAAQKPPYPEDKFFSSDGLNSSWAQVRDNTLAKLLEERGGAENVPLLDRIVLERLSYLYARIRQREALGVYGSEAAYAKAMNLLAQFMAEVRKADNSTQLLELMKADLVDAMVQGAKEAMHDLPADQQRTVMQSIIKVVDSPVAGVA